MKKFTIYLAGDSTVQSYKTPVKPITGWVRCCIPILKRQNKR